MKGIYKARLFQNFSFVRKFFALPAILILWSCQLFLGPDPENSPRGIFDALWNDFNDTYALMDIKMDLIGSNWDQIYKIYSPQISSGMTDRQLFGVCANMLKELNDSHVSLNSSFAESNSGGFFDTSNMDPFSLDVIETYLNDGGTYAENNMFLYGTFKPPRQNIGYIFIAGFAYGDVGIAEQNWVKSIDSITKALAHTDGLVVDVRANRGGLISNVDYIAARFASKQKKYITVSTRNGAGKNDFSDSLSSEIIPDGTKYTKPIVLLTNKQTISGGEWFTLALRSQSHVTHAGGTTHGAFSLSLQRPLINGWIYTISVQKVTDMQGICYEGTGIPPPKHSVQNTPEKMLLGIDEQLEYAWSLMKPDN